MLERTVGPAILIAAIALGAAVACGGGPPKCPTVQKASSAKAIDIVFSVRSQIDESVKYLLLDPSSYEEEYIIFDEVLSEARDDGSKYYSEVEVNFRANNALGRASVTLSEDPDRGCVVVNAALD